MRSFNPVKLSILTRVFYCLFKLTTGNDNEILYSKKPHDAILSVDPDSPGTSCPLTKYQVNALLELYKDHDNRIEILEDERRALKIALGAGASVLFAVFYLFDWVLVNYIAIREIILSYLSE